MVHRLLAFLLLANCLGSGFASAAPARRPNFLIILADDCTFSDLPMYGGQNARTPNLEKLASQGLIFNRAYLASAMCQPCRSELYSGLYPHRNGCSWNHSSSRPDVKSMPQHLSPLGYRVGIAGKVHVTPKEVYPFEMLGGLDANCVRNPTRPHDLASVAEFMSRDSEAPFCLVVALVEPHVPWVMGDASQYPPKTLRLPPNIADTPRTRQDFSSYLAEITYMDQQVGEILQVLELSGQSGETLVLFSSEQGAQFPGNKWTNWDTGLHTALMARWPGHVPSGKRTDALVQYADVLPTLMELAGAKPASGTFDGSSFLPVLSGQSDSHRQYVYGMHNNIPEGPAYPVRSISDGSFRYIENLTPDEIYIEKHLMGIQGKGELNNPYWATWVAQAWNNPHTYNLVKRYTHRPPVEFYHTARDPFELNNLASASEHHERMKEMALAMHQWMIRQGDPGIPLDSHEAVEASRNGAPLFSVPVP